MATRSTQLWEVERPWLSAVRVLVLIALSPFLIGAALVELVLSRLSFLFPPRPSSADDMVEGLTAILTVGDDSWDMDDAIGNVVGRRYPDVRLEQLRRRVEQLPDLPWTQTTIDEIAIMRDGARAIAEEGTQNDR